MADLLTKLQESLPGIDVETGMMYCGDDEEIYASIIESFCEESLVEELKNEYETSNVEDYATHAHAVKSSALTIGLAELSEVAKTSEFAAKENNMEKITENHEKLLSMYESAINVLKDIYPEFV